MDIFYMNHMSDFLLAAKAGSGLESSEANLQQPALSLAPCSTAVNAGR